MSASLNKVLLIGNVGKDPDIRTTQDGREIANLSVATSESWKDKKTGERKDRVEWNRVVIFSEGLVGVVKQYVKKGSRLYIEGQLQTRKWTDKDGAEKYATEVVLQGFASSLILLDSRGEKSSEAPTASQSTGAASSLLDDEIPFSLGIAMAGLGLLMSLLRVSGVA